MANAKLTPSMEDYLESIIVIKKEKGIVRTKELAKRLNVKLPSVTEAVQNLSEKGLVTYKRYADIKITNKGEKLADEIYNKHKMLIRFFKDVLNINDKTAKKDACKIEHLLSKESFDKLMRFLERC